MTRIADVPAIKPVNWTNALTLVSVGILVGAELLGAGAAAGWAIGGLLQIGDWATRGLQGIFIALATLGLTFFIRAAMRHEPIRT